MLRVLWVLLSIVLIAVSCAGSSSEDPTATPTMTPTPGPTATPTATPTVTPTPTPEPCSTDDGELVYELLDEFSQELQDELELAGSTPRMQLAGQISALQDTRRLVQRQEWPECGEKAKDLLVEHMDLAIDSLIAFLGQEPDREVSRLVDDSLDKFQEFLLALVELQP